MGLLTTWSTKKLPHGRFKLAALPAGQHGLLEVHRVDHLELVPGWN